MFSDELTEWAHDAGALQTTVIAKNDFLFSSVALERFAAKVAAAEREACAKACEEEAKRAYKNDGLDDGYEAGKSVAAKNCAAAIRAGR